MNTPCTSRVVAASSIHIFFAAAAIGLVACGSDSKGNGEISLSDPNAVVRALDGHVIFGEATASLQPGAPPSPTGGIDAPVVQLSSSSLVLSSPIATLPLRIFTSEGVTPAALFVEVPGADYFLKIDLTQSTDKQQLADRPKAVASAAPLQFAYLDTMPPDSSDQFGGSICYEISVQDTAGQVSEASASCIGILGPGSPLPTLPPSREIDLHTALKGTWSAACLNLPGNRSERSTISFSGQSYVQRQERYAARDCESSPATSDSAIEAKGTYEGSDQTDWISYVGEVVYLGFTPTSLSHEVDGTRTENSAEEAGIGRCDNLVSFVDDNQIVLRLPTTVAIPDSNEPVSRKCRPYESDRSLGLSNLIPYSRVESAMQ